MSDKVTDQQIRDEFQWEKLVEGLRLMLHKMQGNVKLQNARGIEGSVRQIQLHPMGRETYCFVYYHNGERKEEWVARDEIIFPWNVL